MQTTTYPTIKDIIEIWRISPRGDPEEVYGILKRMLQMATEYGFDDPSHYARRVLGGEYRNIPFKEGVNKVEGKLILWINELVTLYTAFDMFTVEEGRTILAFNVSLILDFSKVTI